MPEAARTMTSWSVSMASNRATGVAVGWSSDGWIHSEPVSRNRSVTRSVGTPMRSDSTLDARPAASAMSVPAGMESTTALAMRPA